MCNQRAGAGPSGLLGCGSRPLGPPEGGLGVLDSGTPLLRTRPIGPAPLLLRNCWVGVGFPGSITHAIHPRPTRLKKREQEA